MSLENKPSPVEEIKIASDGLRGTIQQSLTDEITGAIREDDQTVIKFHGMYQQDNRDRREERAAKKLDRLYSFMLRLRLPGGFLTPAQWLATHHIAGAHSTGVIKITSRQTIQLHGIIRSEIRPTISSFNKMKLDSIATCGDINRNVTCSAHPDASPVHAEVFAYADKISTLLMPKTKAYYEIWLDDEKLMDKKEEEDPLYKDRYLPRKLKIAIAIPPNNDVDVFTNDIGLIAIVENGRLTGFNIAIGGGLGTTHGNAETYPRLGNVIGFADTEAKILKAVYEIVTIQRDYGNRSDRKLSRLKYTVDKYGLDWYVKELENRTGFQLEAAKPYVFTARGDEPGWAQNNDGKWYYTVMVENGRVLDDERMALKTALYQIAETGAANIRFTANQNLIIGDVSDSAKASVHTILEEHAVVQYNNNTSEVRRNAMACVALPTCPLALAEGQRYLPELISKIELLTARHQITQEKIIIRMTGCPNGCARPFNAEMGFVGTAPGRYNMYLGGDHEGTRLNKLYKEQLAEPEILTEIDQWFSLFVQERIGSEKFGDYTYRKIWPAEMLNR